MIRESYKIFLCTKKIAHVSLWCLLFLRCWFLGVPRHCVLPHPLDYQSHNEPGPSLVSQYRCLRQSYWACVLIQMSSMLAWIVWCKSTVCWWARNAFQPQFQFNASLGRENVFSSQASTQSSLSPGITYANKMGTVFMAKHWHIHFTDQWAKLA